MHVSSWIGAALGVVMIASAAGPPPVVLDLGPVVPTPVPTTKGAERKRIITTITVQNAANGESVISFEATDFADQGEGKQRVLAAKSYSLADEKPELKAMTTRIVEQVRALERDMLEYAAVAGPPKERAPMSDHPGTKRPYR